MWNCYRMIHGVMKISQQVFPCQSSPVEALHMKVFRLIDPLAWNERDGFRFKVQLLEIAFHQSIV